MANKTRRELVGAGLVAATASLLAPRYAAANEDDGRGLQFHLASDYQPNLSAAFNARLTAAMLSFLEDSHPVGMTMAVWDQNPRDISGFEKHVSNIVSTVLSGVTQNLGVYPVDPVLVLALLYNESRLSPSALSSKGALGVAQFMPETALEYGLSPLAHADLWARYRDLRQSEQSARARARRKFLKRFKMDSFTANEAIRAALKNESLDVLAAYREIESMPVLEQEVLDAYLAAIREEFARRDVLSFPVAEWAKFDARLSYGAAAAAVAYLARQLRANAGMTTTAVAAYNAGPAAVREKNTQSVLHAYGRLPAYAETVHYVQRILAVYTELRQRLV